MRHTGRTSHTTELLTSRRMICPFNHNMTAYISSLLDIGPGSLVASAAGAVPGSDSQIGQSVNNA